MDLNFGALKKKKMKPSDIKPEEEKEYYCIGDVPENGIAIYNKGWFIPVNTLNAMLNKNIKEVDELKNELAKKEIEYDRLKLKYDALLMQTKG